MRSARCRYLAGITGVAIVTDSTSYVPAAAGSGLHYEDRGEHPEEQKADSAKTKTC